MNEKDFKRLLAAYLDGELADDEIVVFKDAVEGVPSYRHRFQEEVRLHTLMRELTAEQMEAAKMAKGRKRKGSPPPKRKPVLAYILAAAAAVMIGGMITAMIVMQNQPKPIGYCMHVSGEGRQEVLRGKQTLPLRRDLELFPGDRIINADQGDAMVSLNDGSAISITAKTDLTLFAEAGVQVSLAKGEVLLEVAKRAASAAPFKVSTADSVMTVLGTVFTVRRDSKATLLEVYEGAVQLDRDRDALRVKVKASQSVITSDPGLKVVPIKQPDSSGTDAAAILPTDDAYIEGRRAVNSQELRVRGEPEGRVIYLRFHIKDVGVVKRAELQMNQSIDPGSGTLRFFLGSHSDWTEKSLNAKSAPEAEREIAVRRGVVSRGRTIKVDLSDGIKADGVYTIVVTLDQSGASDIWFSSKEGARPPRLILTR